MTDIFVKRMNETYAQVQCDTGIAMELSEHFSYYVPGYQWSPKYKYSNWDGKIKEFNRKNNTIRAGLIHELRNFAKDRDYSISDDGSFGYEEFSVIEAKEFIETLDLPEPYNNVYDHQIKGFVGCVRENRCIRIMPTSSGKSLTIYLLTQFYEGKKLIVVPTIGLVEQMASDFVDYGYTGKIHKITGGSPKSAADADITISTWQSIYKLSSDYFSAFDVVIGDEVHLFSANSLTGIMDKCVDVKYRFGFTGTLSGSKTHDICLTGMFGKIHKVISTKELMDKGLVADLSIKVLSLKYSPESRKMIKGLKYDKEISWLISHPKRNQFIRNLALSLDGNTLILFRNVAHGEYLYEIIKKKTNRPVYFIAGKTEAEEREEIRRIMEVETDAITIASKGTTSTGTNIRNLHNLIFAHPSKSKVNTLQSIGRSLRLSKLKKSATLYDIADDLRVKSHKNHTFNHLLERLKIYAEEQFKFQIYEIDLKE